ncbi:MAG TPA: fibronectin type III domain-containing protein [Candidatus Acidoferrales bacterium]|nr:fibronectin type III domain-containing protein [Candidatus Acidoferrales bacterium]
MRKILILSMVIVLAQTYAAESPSRHGKGKKVLGYTIIVKPSSEKKAFQSVVSAEKQYKPGDAAGLVNHLPPSGGSGKIFNMQSVESGVNLTPYQPAGWSDKIVIYKNRTNITGSIPTSLTDASVIYPTDSVFVAWAITNNGTDNISTGFYTDVYVDNVEIYNEYLASLSGGYYWAWWDGNIGKLSPGVHTFEVYVDPTSAIAETNESDNIYTRQYTISPGLPNAPTNLKAVAVSSGQIDLTWTASTGSPAYYRVLRSTSSPSAFSSIDTLRDSSATECFSVFLNPNTTYYYEVIAGNSTGESSPSATVSATTPGYSSNWTIQNKDSVSWWAIKAVDTSTVWACGYSAVTGAGNAYIERSTDGGTTWVNCSGSLASIKAAISTIEATSRTQAWAGDQFGNIYYTSNGGSTWVTQSSGTANFINAIKYVSSNTLVAVADPINQGDPFLILRTTDNGSTWAVVTGTPSSRSDVHEFCIANSVCMVGDTIFAGTQYYGESDGRAIASIDGGITWYIPSWHGLPWYFQYSPTSISFRNGLTGIVTGDSGFAEYCNDAPWTSISKFVPDWINASQAISGTLTYWAAGEDGVFHSTDDGSTWSIESVPFQKSIGAIAFPTATKGWVASGEGMIARYSATTSSPSSPALVGPTNSSTGAPTNPTLSWNASAGATSYRLQVSTSAAFVPIFFDRSNILTTSQSVSGLSRSTTYYWRVDASNVVGPSSWSPTWSFTTFAYPSSIQVSTQFMPPGTLDQTSYRIFGLPGDIDIALSGVVSGTQGKDWDAYWDNGDDQNYYVEYDGSGRFYFMPGTAFWILSKNPFSVSQFASTVPLDTSACFSITLHSGWNLISNPFEKSVSWSAIQTLNGVAQPIYSFNGSYSTQVSFDPYVGYYFYNNQNLVSLKVPYITTVQNKKEERPWKVSSDQKNEVKLSLLSKKNQPLPISVGFYTEASDTLDNVNIFAPPDNFEDVRIQVVDQNVGGNWKKLYVDFRNEIGKGQSFDIEVKNLSGDPVTMNSFVHGLEDYGVYLVDNGTHAFYNLKTSDSILIGGVYKYKNYALLVGDGNYIDSIRAVNTPRSYQLYQNYPNPFNPSTIIRYEIPGKAEVTLGVYNVLGQLVRTLVNQVQQSGYYEVEFDGTHLASGVYFCRLTVNGIESLNAGTYDQIKKMTLIK